MEFCVRHELILTRNCRINAQPINRLDLSLRNPLRFRGELPLYHCCARRFETKLPSNHDQYLSTVEIYNNNKTLTLFHFSRRISNFSEVLIALPCVENELFQMLHLIKRLVAVV